MSPYPALPSVFARERGVASQKVQIRFSSALRGTPPGSDTLPWLKNDSQIEQLLGSVAMRDKRTVLGRPGVHNPLLIGKNGSDKKIFHFRLSRTFDQFDLIFVSAFVSKFELRRLRDESSADWIQNIR